jgi:hypothetical protein
LVQVERNEHHGVVPALVERSKRRAPSLSQTAHDESETFPSFMLRHWPDTLFAKILPHFGSPLTSRPDCQLGHIAC